MHSIRAHVISCLVLSVVCAGCSAVHKHGPVGKEHGSLESATVSGPACVVIRRGLKVDVVQFVEAGQTETIPCGSDDSIFQLSVFPPGPNNTCGNYGFNAGVLCMKCGAGGSDSGQLTGIACCP